MTEEEAKNALFQLHFNYMKHPPKERLALYEEYQSNRKKVKEELAKLILQRKQEELNNKLKTK